MIDTIPKTQHVGYALASHALFNEKNDTKKAKEKRRVLFITVSFNITVRDLSYNMMIIML